MAFSEALKLKVKKRSHFRCCVCQAVGVEVHHIIPQEDTGPDTEENAAPLCPTCHEIYGANRTKRKFIREARDAWYEICDRRYAADVDRLDELKKRLDQTISYDDFQTLKNELIDAFAVTLQTPRSEQEILAELDVLFDKIWYNRNRNHLFRVKRKLEELDPGVLVIMKQAMRKVENKYGKDNLGPWDDFEWGMLNGKMSALRWVLGDDWDFLDT